MTLAVLHTSLGEIRIDLLDNHAPKTVANFVGLADGTRQWTDPQTRRPGAGPLYTDVLFHRIIRGFMIQGGDPTGTGRGGPGYRFPDEFHPELVFDQPYLLAMANAGPGTNGSQFFITVNKPRHLDRKHTIFGKVSDQPSRDVVDAIATTPVGPGDRPMTDVVLTSVTIEK